MYKIFYADLGKITGEKEIGTRPVVSVKTIGEKAIVYKITSRMRPDFRHVRMNNYKIFGFCDVSKSYTIPKNMLKWYQRDCTRSETDEIRRRANRLDKNAII